MDVIAICIIALGMMMSMLGWGWGFFKAWRQHLLIGALVFFFPITLLLVTFLDWREYWKATTLYVMGVPVLLGGLFFLRLVGDPNDYVLISLYSGVDPGHEALREGSPNYRAVTDVNQQRVPEPERTTPLVPGAFVQTADTSEPAAVFAMGPELYAAAAGGGLLVFALTGFGVWTLLGAGGTDEDDDPSDDDEDLPPLVQHGPPPVG